MTGDAQRGQDHRRRSDRPGTRCRLATAFPKPLTDDVVRAADVVITMGCGDACPVYPGKRYEDWDVADPDGADDARLAAIHDDLDRRVHALLTDLIDTEPR